MACERLLLLHNPQFEKSVVRPEGFEPPAFWFVGNIWIYLGFTNQSLVALAILRASLTQSPL